MALGTRPDCDGFDFPSVGLTNRVSSALPQCSDEDERRFSADKPCWTKPRGCAASIYGDCKAVGACRHANFSLGARAGKAADIKRGRLSRRQWAVVVLVPAKGVVGRERARQSAADRTCVRRVPQLEDEGRLAHEVSGG